MICRCAVLDDYQGVALSAADWGVLRGQVEVDVFRKPLSGPDELVEALSGHEIAVIMRERTRFDAEVLARLPELRLLVTTGMRNAAIDLDAARRRGVVVCGTRGRSEPTAELTWALILGTARHIVTEAGALRSGGPWQQTVGLDLAGARLGVMGLGTIGVQVARIGLAFGMDVLAWSPHLTAARAADVGVALAASKDELLATSDVVTIHLVLGDRTHNLIGAAELALMRPSTILVNTSRGPIVDERALVAALADKTIAGAGLDVFDTEPLPADHPLRRLPNVLATPHLGYVTGRTYERFYGDAVEDVSAYLAGASIRRLT
jgi:phosphoglycerate dehydrogenase-like enzyme